MAMYCNNFEFNESRDDFLLNAEPPEAFAMYPNSNPGPPGPPGPGFAPGGTTGQVLVKASNEDFDTEWSSLYNKADVIVDSVGPDAIASFPDGANNMPIREIVATVEPVQDLHGYSNPWPAGGGNNKFLFDSSGDNTNVEPSVTRTYQNEMVTFSGTSTSANRQFYAKDVTSIIASLGTAYVTAIAKSVTNVSARINVENNGSVVDRLAFLTADGVTPKTVTYTSGYTYLLLGFIREAVATSGTFGIQISGVNTTWSPYSNICPISGHAGTTLYLDDEVYPFVQGGLNDSSGAESSTANRIRTGYIPIPANDTITIGLATGQESDDVTRRIYYYSGESTDTFISSDTLDNSAQSLPYTYTMTKPTGAAYIRFVLQKSVATNAISPTGKVLYISPTTIPISWQDEAGTVYGGTLTINEDGSLGIKVNKAKSILNDKTKWRQIAGTITFQYDVDFERKLYTDSYTGLLCSAFKADSTMTNYCRWAGANSKYFGVRTMDGSIEIDVLETLSENGDFSICYDIEPVSYTLESFEQLFTKLGVNNIWVNTGDTSVTYPCDTKLYIDKKIAALA